MDTYDVLIHWHGCTVQGTEPDFAVSTPSEGEDPKDAARKRCEKLADPSNYTQVLVISPCGDRAYVYSVRELLNLNDGVPRPRYGWR